jgi:hypothetical protein
MNYYVHIFIKMCVLIIECLSFVIKSWYVYQGSLLNALEMLLVDL